MTKVKFCGMRYPADIEKVNLLRPDYAGFVFHPGDPRYVSPEDARKLVDMLDPSIVPIGVFYRADEPYIADCVERSGVRMVQVSGCTDDTLVTQVRTLTEYPVMRVFRISIQEDVSDAESSIADTVMLDVGHRVTGEYFDWSLLKNFGRSFFLTGEFTPENVGSAIVSVRPYAVNVNSGVETDGKKDADRMRRFLDAVRSADNQ